jgi:predicted Holliday junction resolvase-like endonuclease
MLVLILLVIIGILCVVLFLLNCQIKKMINEAIENEDKYNAEKRELQDKLYDSEAENRELERTLAEVEERAKNAEMQRDFLKNSKTMSMAPAGWNMVLADQEKKETEEEK